MLKRGKHVHMVGIGGEGMSGIAEVLANLGYNVTGSDLASSATTRRLEQIGITVFQGHDHSNITGADILVYSSAIPADNCELREARELKIPVMKRAEMLAELMRMKYGIAVAGSHGKTTTTSMIGDVLALSGLDPTLVVGGRIAHLDAHARLGEGEILVAEADESDGTFMSLSPTVSVVTSIDYEHMDFYRDMDHLRNTFLDFINKVPFYGVSILCCDDDRIREILPGVTRRYICYGSDSSLAYSWKNAAFEEESTCYDLYCAGEYTGTVTLKVPGIHNVLNSLAAIAVGVELGIDIRLIIEALESYKPVDRRFQVKGTVNDILIIDDYGHHPTEIAAVLKAARAGWNRRIITVFQPHRYSRSRDLADRFGPAFTDTDLLITTEIYPAGETPIAGVDGRMISERIIEHRTSDTHYCQSPAEIVTLLEKIVRPGDMVLTLGAGNIFRVGETLLTILQDRKES